LHKTEESVDKVSELIPLAFPGEGSKRTSFWDKSGTMKKNIESILNAVKAKSGLTIGRNTFIMTALKRYLKYLMDSKDISEMTNKVLEENHADKRSEYFTRRKNKNSND